MTGLLLAALGLAAGTAASAECKKSVRWNDDQPYSHRLANGEIVGIMVEQVRENLRRVGCVPVMVEMPWARALAELEAGRLDLLPGALRSLERERFAYFSVPGPLFANALFAPVRPTNLAQFTTLADLRGTGYRLGTQIGVSYGPVFDRLMQDPVFAAQVQRVSSRQSLWKMLEAGRLDGVLADQQTGRLELAALGLQEQIKGVGLIVPHGGSAVAFSKKSVDQRFVTRYNEAFASMLADGSMAAILLKYGAQTLPR